MRWRMDDRAPRPAEINDRTDHRRTAGGQSRQRLVAAWLIFAALAVVAPGSSVPAQPVLVKTICDTGTSCPSHVRSVGGDLFFQAESATSFGLWKSNGTAAGTEIVKDGIFVGALTNVGGTLYFVGPAETPEQSDALWKSNGTEAGTERVVDINPFIGNGGVYGFVGDVNGTLVFVGNDGTTGTQLWASDGTAANTVEIGEPPHNDPVIIGGIALYQQGGSLWRTDGTAAGTELVKEIAPTFQAQFFRALVDGTLYFRADDITNGLELWKSDGTTANTMLVKNIRAGAADSDPLPLGGAAGTLYFQANDGTGTGRELWKTDGTAANTVLVKDINAGGNSDPNEGAAVGSTFFFSADDGTTGGELWKTNGTSETTMLVKDIRPGDTGSFPQYMTAVDGTLYFAADDGTNGVELWQSDGTEAGTVMVADINASGDSSPSELRNFGDTLVFQADDGTNVTLWRLFPDGDADGVPNTSDLCPTTAEDVDGLQDADGCPETDADGDGIADDVDELPETSSDRFSDGTTIGQILRLPVGTPPTIQVVDHPNPARGVRVTVSGGTGPCSSPATPCPRAEVRLDGSTTVSRFRSPGTYNVTKSSVIVETELDGPAEVEVLGNIVVIDAGEEATIVETDTNNDNVPDQATITPGSGDTITVNGQPTTQPTVVTPPSSAPACNGQAATIYVGSDGKIVGGPRNGLPYRGAIPGTGGANVIVGTGGNDTIEAKGGNDVVCSGGGNDEIEAGGGADVLLGEGGNDKLLAGAGHDVMTGGLGADAFRGGDGRDRATDYTPSQGDTKQSVEQF